MARPHDPNAKVELLRAAEAVFVEHGLERAKVEDITARAGRSKGSFYLHFESKEEAFRQIVETLLARMASCIDEPPPEHDPGPIDAAALLARSIDKDVEIFEFLWQNRALCRLLLAGGGSRSFAYLIDQFAERSRETIRRWLVWGQARGIYRQDLDVELVSLILSGAYDRLAREMLREGRPKPDLRGWMLSLQATLGTGIFTPEVAAIVDPSVKKDDLRPPSPPAGRARRKRARTPSRLP